MFNTELFYHSTKADVEYNEFNLVFLEHIVGLKRKWTISIISQYFRISKQQLPCLAPILLRNNKTGKKFFSVEFWWKHNLKLEHNIRSHKVT